MGGKGVSCTDWGGSSVGAAEQHTEVMPCDLSLHLVLVSYSSYSKRYSIPSVIVSCSCFSGLFIGFKSVGRHLILRQGVCCTPEILIMALFFFFLVANS